MSEHAIPESLLENIKAGHAALVVGARIAGSACWSDLLAQMSHELVERSSKHEGTDDAEYRAVTGEVADLLHKGEHARAAGFLARRLGRELVSQIAGKIWQVPDEIPPVARAVARLPFRYVWTTLPGDWLESAISVEQPEGWPQLEVVTYQRTAAISRHRRALVEILGHFETHLVAPKTVRDALTSATALHDHVGELYTRGSLVFVGFCCGDPDLTILLDRLFSPFDTPSGEHYLVTSGIGPVTAEQLEREHRIQVVKLAASNDHCADVAEGYGRVANSLDDRAAPHDVAAGDAPGRALLDYLEALALACRAAEITLTESDPADDDFEGWLNRWAEEPELARRAVERILEATRKGDDAEKLVEMLAARLERAEEPAERVPLLRESARVLEQRIGDLDRALAALIAALRETPADIELVDEAARVADAAASWTEFVAEVSQLAGELTDAGVAAEYWLHLGSWYLRRLDPTAAITAYRQALEFAPDAVDAYIGLADLYRSSHRWTELADLITEHVAIENDVKKAHDLYLALGELYETQLASSRRAIDAYQSAAELARDNDAALAALERLFRRDERWSKLADVLDQQAQMFETTNSRRSSAIRRELAALRADKLDDQAGAIAEYEAALAVEPDDSRTLRALADLYESSGQTDEYLRTLEALIDALPEGEQPLLLSRLAEDVAERDRQKATWCYERIIVIERAGPVVERAYRALERFRRHDGAWQDLANTLAEHIEVAEDAHSRSSMYIHLAAIYDTHLNDPHRAIEAYLHSLELDDKNRTCLAALGNLFQQTGAWARAVQVMVQHAELENDPSLWYGAGKVATEHFNELRALVEKTGQTGQDAGEYSSGEDPAAVAERCLEKTLEMMPGHKGALLALAELDKVQSRWASAADNLIRAEEHCTTRRERVEIMVAAAEILEQRLGDRERALDLYLRVLEIDPDNADIGLRAGEQLSGAGRYEEAVPILEMLAKRSVDGASVASLEARLGRAYSALGDHQAAAEHYRRATERAPDDHEAALGLANAIYATAERTSGQSGTTTGTQGKLLLEQWREVDRLYRELLAHHRAGLADGNVVEIWYRLGRAAQQIGADDKADGAYRRALERDPIHGPSLAAIAEVAAVRGDWHSVIENKRIQIDATLGKDEYEGEPRVRLLTEIGDVYYKELHDPMSALDAYREALELQPTSSVLLHRVLDIYTERNDWRHAVATLANLADHEVVERRRAKYRYAAAVIARDELGDNDLAVEQFSRVLDVDPTNTRSLQAIDQLLGDLGDYRKLACTYRDILKRIGDDAPLETLLPLWTRVGEICLTHLNDIEAGMAALEVASSLEPGNMERHEELANLYLEYDQQRRDDAIDELQILLQNTPNRIELYRALSDLYAACGDTDKAYCLAQALVFLGAANEAESEFFSSHRPGAFSAASRRLTEELWRTAIVHPGENVHLNAMFAALCVPIASLTARPASAFDLSDDDRVEIDRGSSMPVARVFNYAADILALEPKPSLYVRDSSDGIRVANTHQHGRLVPSVLVGQPHIGIDQETVLAFQVGKRLAYLRPERYAHYALQTVARLETAFAAMLAASGAGDRMTGRDAADMAEHIRDSVPEPILDQVATLAHQISPGVAATGLITGWRSAADLTANRAGFILCNDLETAARVIATESAAMSTLSAKERLLDLLAYSVSERYFAIRRHLGLAIDN